MELSRGSRGLALYTLSGAAAAVPIFIEHAVGAVGLYVSLIAYGPALIAAAVAAPLPSKFRPWPLYAALVVPMLYTMLLFALLFAGGALSPLLYLAHLAVIGGLIAGTLSSSLTKPGSTRYVARLRRRASADTMA